MDTELLVKAGWQLLTGSLLLAVAAVPLGAVGGLGLATGWLVFRAVVNAF